MKGKKSSSSNEVCKIFEHKHNDAICYGTHDFFQEDDDDFDVENSKSGNRSGQCLHCRSWRRKSLTSESDIRCQIQPWLHPRTMRAPQNCLQLPPYPPTNLWRGFELILRSQERLRSFGQPLSSGTRSCWAPLWCNQAPRLLSLQDPTIYQHPLWAIL